MRREVRPGLRTGTRALATLVVFKTSAQRRLSMAKSTRGVRRGRRHPTTVAASWAGQRVPHPGIAPDLSRDAPPRLALRPRHPDLPPDLSRDPRRRLAMLDWHRAHGANVSRTGEAEVAGRPTDVPLA